MEYEGNRQREPIGQRDVVDADQTVWHISETHALDVPGSLGARCLIFESSTVVRRLWTYPADWMSRPDTDVLALMNRLRIVV